MECGVIVSSAEFNLEAAVPDDVRCETGEGLFAGTPNAHQEGVPALLTDHTCDAGHVLYGVEEEDELHLLRARHVIVIQVLEKKEMDIFRFNYYMFSKKKTKKHYQVDLEFFFSEGMGLVLIL